MLKRVITAVVLSVLLIVGFIFPVCFDIICVLALVLSQYEMINAFKKGGRSPLLVPLIVYTLLIIPAVMISGFAPQFLLAFSAMIAVAIPVFSDRPGISDVADTLYILLYPDALITLWIQINHLKVSPAVRTDLLVCVFLLAAMADTGGFFGGRALGKHKLNERVSPNKTTEGFVAGILFSTLAGFLYGLAAAAFLPGIKLGHYVLMGLIAGFVTPLGDLTASALKRKIGLKDYGNIFPGHGGCMDRIDGMLFNGAAVFLYFCLFLEKGLIG